MNSHLHRIRRLIQSASKSSFYQAKFAGLRTRGAVDLKKLPATSLEELVAEKARSGDPYSSRWCGQQDPLVVVQLDYGTESPLYLPFDRRTLRSYAEALGRCLDLVGLKKGNAVAIYDYGTSPVSFLASAAFTPYLKKGPAETLGCLTICNDGIASMSGRAIDILKYVRPRILFVRAECLHPLALEVEGQLSQLSDYTGGLVVSENESLLSKADQDAFERRLGVPVYRLLRVDLALFFAMECPKCRLLHSWEDLYNVETFHEAIEGSSSDSRDDCLVVTNWFARSCPAVRYLSRVRGSVVSGGCSISQGDIRIVA